MYGRDRGARRGGLAQLLERLHEVDGIEWIRLLYLYPATVDRELIDAMAALPKVCKYMDMPLQHAHPDVLRAMLRPSNGERYLEIIDDFRARVPGITMRSTFIVGFPGETEEHVSYLRRVDRASRSSIASVSSNTARRRERRVRNFREKCRPVNGANGSCVCVRRNASRPSVRAGNASASVCACSSKSVVALRKSDPLRDGARRARCLVRPFAWRGTRRRRGGLFQRRGANRGLCRGNAGRSRTVRFLRTRVRSGASRGWVSTWVRHRHRARRLARLVFRAGYGAPPSCSVSFCLGPDPRLPGLRSSLIATRSK